MTLASHNFADKLSTMILESTPSRGRRDSDIEIRKIGTRSTKVQHKSRHSDRAAHRHRGLIRHTSPKSSYQAHLSVRNILLFALRLVHILATFHLSAVYARVSLRAFISTVEEDVATKLGIHPRAAILPASGTLGVAPQPHGRLEETSREKQTNYHFHFGSVEVQLRSL